MDEGDERSQVFAAIEESVCPDPDVEFVVAFGSRVSGEPTRSSDFDFAVKFADNLSDRERFEKRCFLSGDLQQEDAPFVDLSDIETLPLPVAHEAIHGVFVCGDDDTFGQCKDELETRFAEQRDALRRRHRDVINRIAEDGLRG